MATPIWAEKEFDDSMSRMVSKSCRAAVSLSEHSVGWSGGAGWPVIMKKARRRFAGYDSHRYR